MDLSNLNRTGKHTILVLAALLVAVAGLFVASSNQDSGTTSASSPGAAATKKPRPSPTSTSSPTAPPTSATCSSPAFVTSRADETWDDGGYIVHNNMWNAKRYKVSQTLYACAFDNWYVVATANDSSGDGAVKTYPNVHKDYHDWSTGAEPPLSSFSTIQSTFAATAPDVGIYDVAYDIWLNGVPGNREIMIWTKNHGQVPAGSVVAKDLAFGGHTWDLWATRDNDYLAFVPTEPMTQGSLDLKAMLDHLDADGRIPPDSTLGQICFGLEVVSTDGRPVMFSVSGFSITDSRS